MAGNGVTQLDNAFLRAIAARGAMESADGIASQPQNQKVDAVEKAAFLALAQEAGIGGSTLAKLGRALDGDSKVVLDAPRMQGVEAAAARFPRYFDLSTMRQILVSCGCGPVDAYYADAKGNLMLVSIDEKNSVKVSFARAEEVPASAKGNARATVELMHDQPAASLSKGSIEFIAEHMFTMMLRDARNAKPETHSGDVLAALGRPAVSGNATPAGINLDGISFSEGTFSKDHVELTGSLLKDGTDVSLSFSRDGNGPVDITYTTGSTKIGPKRISAGEAEAIANSFKSRDGAKAMWQVDFDTHNLLAVIAQSWDKIGD